MTQDVSNRQRISADGSDRTFRRVEYRGRPAVAIYPAPGPEGLREARSYFLIGSHLYSRGVNVPELLDFDEETGRILVEDLGDCHLQRLLQGAGIAAVAGWYEQAVRVLARMQALGTHGFDPGWCFDTGTYDSELAYSKEALYFADWFLVRYLGRSLPRGLTGELESLCARVDRLPGPKVVLHRDFQSRNLMVYDQTIFIIDFQGARTGPPGYDLASLLIDPYVNIPAGLWDGLLGVYYQELQALGLDMEPDLVHEQLHLLSLLRNLQVLGAFSFLTLGKKRRFFEPFIPVAIERLKALLAMEWTPGLELLKELVQGIRLEKPLSS